MNDFQAVLFTWSKLPCLLDKGGGWKGFPPGHAQLESREKDMLKKKRKKDFGFRQASWTANRWPRSKVSDRQTKDQKPPSVSCKQEANSKRKRHGEVTHPVVCSASLCSQSPSVGCEKGCWLQWDPLLQGRANKKLRASKLSHLYGKR